MPQQPQPHTFSDVYIYHPMETAVRTEQAMGCVILGARGLSSPDISEVSALCQMKIKRTYPPNKG